MIASGSTDGSETCTSLVATSFTQSVEPGKGTTSTLMPSPANQPIFCAIASGAAAELTVLAHQPRRTVRGSATATVVVATNPRNNPTLTAGATTAYFITTGFLCW